MPDLIATLRDAHQRLIDENPVPITLQRTTRAPNGTGGRTATPSTVGPITVRVHLGPIRGGARFQTTLPGVIQQDERWGLIAPWDADLRAEPNVRDEFDAPDLGRFRLIKVYPLRYLGQLWGKQADLERVS